MPRVCFRSGSPEDDHEVFRIFESTCAPGLPDMLIRMQYDAMTRSRAAAFPRSVLRIIEIDGAIAGYYRTDMSPECLRIVDIALAPAYRGRGFGSHTLGLLTEEARALSLPVRLSVARTNPAVRLYQRLGFRVTSADEVFLSMELATSTAV